MRFSQSSGIPQLASFDPELRVVMYIATHLSDPERGPQVRLSPADARVRLLVNGELARVHGPRRQQVVAQVLIDERLAEHTCVLRDIPGVDLSEAVRVSKPDLDTPPSKRTFG
jgi:anaerobic selenocysteine-containing dehydrogenase